MQSSRYSRSNGRSWSLCSADPQNNAADRRQARRRAPGRTSARSGPRLPGRPSACVQFSFAHIRQNGKSTWNDREESARGAFQEPLAIEPVVVEGKAVQSCLSRHLDLTLHDVGLSQIVEPKVSRNTRLVMPGEARSAASDVPPLCKAATPPFVVLGDWRGIGGDRRPLPWPLASIRRLYPDLAPRSHRPVAPMLVSRHAHHRRRRAGPGSVVSGLAADGAVMHKRVDREIALEILDAVVRRSEISGRISALSVAAGHVVEDWIDSGVSHVGVLIQIKAFVEEARSPDDRFVILFLDAGRPCFHRGRWTCPPAGSTASDERDFAAGRSRFGWSTYPSNARPSRRPYWT